MFVFVFCCVPFFIAVLNNITRADHILALWFLHPRDSPHPTAPSPHPPPHPPTPAPTPLSCCPSLLSAALARSHPCFQALSCFERARRVPPFLEPRAAPKVSIIDTHLFWGSGGSLMLMMHGTGVHHRPIVSPKGLADTHDVRPLGIPKETPGSPNQA